MKTKNKIARKSWALLLSVLMLAQIVTMTMTTPASAAAGVVENFEPYQTTGSITQYNGDVNKAFHMMGLDYINGFTIQRNYADSNPEILYNLGGAFELMTFDIGHLDNGYNGKATLQIYTDGTLYDTMELTHDMQTVHYSINVSGVDQLRLYVLVTGSGYSYGFANAAVYNKSGLTSAGITAIPAVSSSKIINETNLSGSEYSAPYQTTGSITQYSGDVNKMFYMMGLSYIDGITIQRNYADSNPEILYNLGGAFELMTFDVGHLDNGYNGKATLQIYTDGTLYDTMDLTHDMQNVHYSINVSDVNQLKLYVLVTGSGYSYGFANVTVYDNSGLASAGITAIPEVSSSEIINETNLFGGEYSAPYQTTGSITLYHGDVNSKFNMMGLDYIDGFTIQRNYADSNPEILYNLGGAFELMTFDIGHLDNGYNGSATLQVYADGTLYTTMDLTHNMQSIHYSLNVSGINQLKLYVLVTGSGYSYGFANVTAYDRYDLAAAGISVIPAVSKSEVIKESNLDVDDYLLPYQTYGSVTLYDGDVNAKFTMVETDYIDGITINRNYADRNSELYFNLGGWFDSVTLKAGHIDGGYSGSAALQVYKDGEFSEEYALAANMSTKEYTIDTKGVNQLELYVVVNSGYSYGFANITGTHTHTEVTMPTVTPTCTDNGLIGGVYCETCKKVFEEPSVILSTGHKWDAGEVTTEPEAGKAGVRTFTCSVCGGTKTEIIPAIPEHKHSYEAVVIAPTCSEKGYTTYTCECGVSYVGSKVAALGHNYKNGRCTVCNKKDPDYVAPKPDPKPDPIPFTDLVSGSWYYNSVMWAVDNGITNGTSATTFSPNAICTRSQIVTFLWRAAGSPTPTTKQNPFVDVKKSDYFYKAVLWAMENGITTGTSSTTFAPLADCTRAQVSTFLWRAAGSPKPKGTNTPFRDLVSGSYYYKSVLWAAENGITTGTSSTTFAPEMSCSRAQIVTFLYRSSTVK